MNDKLLMRTALELAEKGRGFTSPNPMVGALVVKDGNIVGRGYHKAAGLAHAEVNAINDAGEKAVGADLYVTLEPCNHQGRTPPCTQKILQAGIKRVFVAVDDPNPDVKGGGNKYLEANGVTVISGICESEAKKLNEIFIKYTKTKLPFVILKCASTLDGRIASRTGDARWVSGEESREFVHQIRHQVDGIMVGIKTVISDDPSLTTRLKHGKGLDPVRIILDTRLSIPENAKLLSLNSKSKTIIVTSTDTNADYDKKERILKDKGAGILKIPLKNGLIDLGYLMYQLGNMGITSLLIEGGSRVIASALKAGIVDKIMFFYAPKILGGDDGFPICRGPGPEFMNQSKFVKDLNIRRFGEDIMIEGYIDNSSSNPQTF
ncbi:Riboflavin biosynthesis protein [Desulfonema limicola]|uniref:Riboflavin biosynthesis protein RibD n=1 Tax=Desulfonema limicola TaxID=45656 RepID=A0A975GFQ0_9BACT|nr:bifunctional diaminohydroxyphosphoribosylaminopyrimidine deaminase/5-amino-6-(5-phosphoribosylamino)uracil reductase RibD [Desulfonema limicola]QTA79497.1 Riboflavin biosynthesis protein [Desulfonema limicola]